MNNPKMHVLLCFLTLLGTSTVCSALELQKSYYFSIGKSVWGNEPDASMIIENLDIAIDPLTGLEVPVRGSGDVLISAPKTTRYLSTTVGGVLSYPGLAWFSLDVSVGANFWYQDYEIITNDSEYTSIYEGYQWQEYPLHLMARFHSLQDPFSFGIGIERNFFVQPSLNRPGIGTTSYSYVANIRTRIFRWLSVDFNYRQACYTNKGWCFGTSNTSYVGKSINLGLVYTSFE